MSRDFVKEKVVFLTKDHVDGLMPYLKWVAEKAPRKQYREAAKSIIRKVRGMNEAKGWKQVLLSKQEELTLNIIHEAFPYEAIVPKQLKLPLE